MRDFVEAGEHAPQRLRRKALDLFDALETHTTVRDKRRRLKELRALATLLGQDVSLSGRSLGRARDAQAAVEAFDRLRDRFASEWTPRQFDKIRRALVARVEATEVEPIRIGDRGRIAAWPVDEMHRDDLLRALAKSYRRARRAMKRAIEQRTPKAIHRWRKRVKTHSYQSHFLNDVGVVQLEPRNDALRKLSRTLGHHHDLTLIQDICEREPELIGTPRYVRLFQTFVERELHELFTIAVKTGRELFQREYARRAGTSTSVHLPGFSKRAAVNFPP